MDSRGVQMKDSCARSSDCIEMNGMETRVGRESVNKEIEYIGRYD
jgi:hypothetical protein